MDNSSSHVESRWRTQLRNRIIQASSLLEILLSGLVLIGLLEELLRETTLACSEIQQFPVVETASELVCKHSCHNSSATTNLASYVDDHWQGPITVVFHLQSHYVGV